MDPVFSVVIPARYASTRLPGKPLADIAGSPMIVHVVRQALASGAREVVVATDDARVQRAIVDRGFDAVLTRTDHQSGSDRVMEVVSAKGWPDEHIVINVQGDEPLIPPAVIRQVAQLLIDAPSLLVATLCEAIDDTARLFDPNVVKLVRDVAGRARYFSRAPIPWRRDDFAQPARDKLLLTQRAWWRHIGIYGYRVAGLAFLCVTSGRARADRVAGAVASARKRDRDCGGRSRCRGTRRGRYAGRSGTRARVAEFTMTLLQRVS
jgi:3-deoxy-manno-octulosonate cytidylyltransferase (CMP-KDO synthetase)